MKIIPSSTIRKTGTLVGATVGEDVVLFDHEQGKYFSTGPIGAEIMRLVDSDTDMKVSDLLNELSSSYDVDRMTLETEVLGFLQIMHDEGLLTAR